MFFFSENGQVEKPETFKMPEEIWIEGVLTVYKNPGTSGDSRLLHIIYEAFHTNQHRNLALKRTQ